MGTGLRSKAWIVEGGEGCGLVFERSASSCEKAPLQVTFRRRRRVSGVLSWRPQQCIVSDFQCAPRYNRANIGLATTSERLAAKAGAKKIWRENRRELPAVAVGRAGRIKAGAARAAAAGLLRPAGRLGLAHNRCEVRMLSRWVACGVREGPEGVPGGPTLSARGAEMRTESTGWRKRGGAPNPRSSSGVFVGHRLRDRHERHREGPPSTGGVAHR